MEYIGRLLDLIRKIFVWWVVIVPWQQGVRVRGGKRVRILSAGIHFRIPLYDQIFVQDVRLRVLQSPPQTVSSKDGKTLTVIVAVGYSIFDIMKVYDSLLQPESTLCHMVQAEIADYVHRCNLEDCAPAQIEEYILGRLQKKDYGISFEYMKITGFAVVRTYRLIQDSHWLPNTMATDQPK